MADQLRVDVEVAFSTSRGVSNDAEELREDLARISREWGNVSHGWSGDAASAFTDIWQDWHQAAAMVVETLAESSRRVGQAAVLYEQQDNTSAQTMGSSPDEVDL